MSDTAPAGVKAIFSANGHEEHRFDSSGRRDAPPPPAGVGKQGPVEGTDKFDYRYTGRHDHGTLPALKSGGPHEELISALLGAKQDSDSFLTGLINQELAAKSDDGHSRGAPGGHAPPKTPQNPSPEAMELCNGGGGGGGGESGGGGADRGVEEEALPPTPPVTQPAKRPKP